MVSQDPQADEIRVIERRSGEHGEYSENLPSEDKLVSAEAAHLFLTCPLRTRNPRHVGLDVGNLYWTPALAMRPTFRTPRGNRLKSPASVSGGDPPGFAGGYLQSAREGSRPDSRLQKTHKPLSSCTTNVEATFCR